MLKAFTGQQAALDFNVPQSPQEHKAASLTLGVVQTAGAGSDTVGLQGSFDGTNYTAISGVNAVDQSNATTLAATGIIRYNVTGIPFLRISKTGTTDTFSAWYNYSLD